MISLPRGWQLEQFAELGSTNDLARQRAEAGAPHGTIIWADRQTAGRGRRGRAWASPPGNLSCTTIIRPVAPGAAGQLAFVVGLALADAIAPLVGKAVQLKWPNDVLVDGQKVAGILLESDSALDWVIAGTGVNIAWAPHDAGFPAAAIGDAATPMAVLERYAAALSQWLDRWQAAGFAAIRDAWLTRAWRLGQAIGVRLAAESFEGRFDDLASDGTLVLTDGAGRQRRVAAGDVFFGAP